MCVHGSEPSSLIGFGRPFVVAKARRRGRSTPSALWWIHFHVFFRMLVIAIAHLEWLCFFLGEFAAIDRNLCAPTLFSHDDMGFREVFAVRFGGEIPTLFCIARVALTEFQSRVSDRNVTREVRVWKFLLLLSKIQLLRRPKCGMFTQSSFARLVVQVWSRRVRHEVAFWSTTAGSRRRWTQPCSAWVLEVLARQATHQSFRF